MSSCCMMSGCDNQCKDRTLLISNVGGWHRKRVYSFCDKCIEINLPKRFYIKLKARDD